MESVISQHPAVDIIWNFFPLDMFIWNPFRGILNAIFIVFYIPCLPFIAIWNLFPEGFMMLSTNILLLGLEGGIIYGLKIYKANTDDFWITYGVIAFFDFMIFSLPTNLLTQWIYVIATAFWADTIVTSFPVDAYLINKDQA